MVSRRKSDTIETEMLVNNHQSPFYETLMAGERIAADQPGFSVSIRAKLDLTMQHQIHLHYLQELAFNLDGVSTKV